MRKSKTVENSCTTKVFKSKAKLINLFNDYSAASINTKLENVLIHNRIPI